jgi:hypothetical protein
MGCTSSFDREEAEEAAAWHDFGPASQPNRHGLSLTRSSVPPGEGPHDNDVQSRSDNTNATDVGQGDVSSDDDELHNPPRYNAVDPPPYGRDGSTVSPPPPPVYTFGLGVLDWTVEDVCTFIHHDPTLRHLEEPVFRGRLLDGERLAALDRAELGRYGVVDETDAATVLAHVAALRRSAGLAAEPARCRAAEKRRREYAGPVAGISLDAVRSGRLQRLSLQSVNITKRQLHELVAACSTSTAVVRWVSLKGNALGAPHAEDVATLVTRSTALRVLDLGGNNFDDRCIQVLTAAMSQSTSLRELSLDHNELGPLSGRALAEMVSTSAGLRSLSVYWNDLGVTGARALLRAVRRSSGLQLLDLSYNGLGRQSGPAIALAIKHNRGLQTLRLADNELDHGAGLLIADALTHNTGLRNLDLSDNRLGTSTVQIIEAWGEHRHGVLDLGIPP